MTVPPDFLFHYNALVTKVYDGDTITADIDLGLGVWSRGQKIRLYGLDTPELRGEEREEGLKVRDYVRARLAGRTVEDIRNSSSPSKADPAKALLKTYKDKTGKYGRWLAEVFVRDEVDGADVWVNLCDELLELNMATVPSYMKK